MKKLMIVIFGIMSVATYGQTKENVIKQSPTSMAAENRYDADGLKDGYWCEMRDCFICFIHYRHGRKNGLARYYNSVSFDYSIGMFKDDEEIGQWQYFCPNGKIGYIIDSISPNTKFIEAAAERNFEPRKSKQCYAWCYDDNGNLKCEGWLVYDEGVEMDTTIEVGTWTHYESDGRITYKVYSDVK